MSFCGDFHMRINFLEAIGSFLNTLGLEEILHVVYGEHAEMLMLTRKAVQRALRGLLLVDKCPNYIMVTDLAAKNPMFASLLVEAETMYSGL